MCDGIGIARGADYGHNDRAKPLALLPTLGKTWRGRCALASKPRSLSMLPPPWLSPGRPGCQLRGHPRPETGTHAHAQDDTEPSDGVSPMVLQRPLGSS